MKPLINELGIEIGHGVRRFFFSPCSAKPFAALRIGLASVLLAQLYFSYQVVSQIYGEHAFLQQELQFFFAPPVFEINALISVLSTWGVDAGQTLTIVLTLYAIALFTLTVGLFSRTSAVLVWLLHFILFQGHLSSYGIDSFAQIFLCYLMLSPSGTHWSIDSLFSAPPKALSPSSFILRAAQIHLAIAYFASGIEKGSGPQWWDGEAIWRSLMLPIYAQYPMGWISHVPWLAVIAGWGTLVLEAGYPFFMFWPKSRPYWVVAIVSLHLGIAIFLGLHLFGFLMAILTLSLFGVPLVADKKLPFSRWVFASTPAVAK